MQADGVNLQDWLQATGTFVGSACKKYPHQMGVHIILQVFLFCPVVHCWLVAMHTLP